MGRQKLELKEDVAEVRNALAIILGNAQLLEKEPGVTQDRKERLEIIVSQVYRVEEF